MPYDDSNWQDKFIIKKSSKKKAGKGLFAKVKIKKGEHIGYYTGKILNGKQIMKEPYISSLYLMQVTEDYYILGEGKGSGFASMINHCKKPNAEMVVSTRWKTARIRAIKKIKKGEEIFYDYGKEYWNNMGKKPK
jgi:SET domain-containing protein